MQLMSLLMVMDLRVTRTDHSWQFVLELIQLKKPCIQCLFKLYYLLFLQHKFDSNIFVGVFLSTAARVQLQKMGLVGEEHDACD
jgi:heme/copper-type cytochrome/quinol oxidase subunit 4